ncbi:NAD(P)-dependent oxidoreductase [Actinoalloteichus sp. AHMU CJ021]|uniref:3-hydroxyisobutyrate dehydrogenase n=1 Tax=Actinoalloteichus caeruleus DSM 43889 TaxID=1120930 RepID=A0ABT1JKZ9_ACTCY|nr:NAD(P)-dependent oxidoreductase [Actinoalloteichus caeruleus]AUS78968.1 NAD(P)-dependent oxidoreductase [Actinoalloteichus sp. AHMU CJ021]MCP2333188.1 3-hydroxyisobutyrate dehydrogenase [Actinoalloteichus caeruleus DSM 43889]
MSNDEGVRVSVLGLGEMGRALAAALVDAGHHVTVWNRTPGRGATLAERGAVVVDGAREAVTASDLVVVCLLGHDSVREVLDPVAAQLGGRTVVNLTTTTPEQARESARWAAEHGIGYLDGGIMAVPPMIGQPGSTVLYSGSREVFDRYRPVLDLWGESAFHGEDAGLACLYDLALLAGMYVMFAGFAQGVAMVRPTGMSATEFAGMAAPWLSAMTTGFAGYASVVDGGDYAVPGQQSLNFSDLGYLVEATREQGVDTGLISAVQSLIRRQIDAGHGDEGFIRIVESLRAAG